MPDFDWEADFEWDETKRAATLKKHNVDFKVVVRMFLDRVKYNASHRNEPRWKAIGVVGGEEFVIVFNIRNGRRGIITARRAHENERREYHDYVA